MKSRFFLSHYSGVKMSLVLIAFLVFSIMGVILSLVFAFFCKETNYLRVVSVALAISATLSALTLVVGLKDLSEVEVQLAHKFYGLGQQKK